MGRIAIILLAAACIGAADEPFARFTIVDMVYSTERDAAGQTVRQQLRRFVIKDARVVAIGGQNFLVGGSPNESKVDVAGSNWARIAVPIDRIVAMVGVESPQELVARPGALGGDVGYQLAR